jgi:alkyl sulfatase BDS1-like metallo-beta-lactamase superfamily hydrolase
VSPIARSLCGLLILAAGCRDCPPDADGDAAGHVAPTDATAAANAAVLDALPFEDRQDFADAARGWIAGDAALVVRDADGTPVWDLPAYGFLTGDPPPSVNPSLWRQAQLDMQHGLFEVTAGVYQVRGYDLANMTLIAGDTGWIVVDPLTAAETAAAAFRLATAHLGPRPVSAVVFTHSHIDHFGGVGGLLDASGADAATLRVIAPAGFLEEATSENLLAGIAMSRRAGFMYGMPLARGPRGHVDSGLGKQPARGKVGILVPTDVVDRTPQAMEIDGVRFVFQYVPDSEAPAELTFYLPEVRAFCGAEVVSHTMHNLYTLRGAQVRDALRWSGYLDEAHRLFPEAEVLFASHHWPTWGRERVALHLAGQRDVYKYLHDQTLRLANQGLDPREIAETMALPPSLARTFANRGYYGTVRHNAKAVYQWYFGWYDGNPAHLDPLPHALSAPRYVELMGGAQAVRAHAADAYERGDYRWAAELLDHAVFADPDDGEARELLARTYDQLGYQAESAAWRDVYLTGAHELRHGVSARPVDLAQTAELLRHVPLARFFDSMATRVDGPAADGKRLVFNLDFTDVGEQHVLTLENSVLHHAERAPVPDADATVRLTKRLFLRLVTQQAGLRELVFSDELDVDGSRLALVGFFRLLDQPDGTFPIVTP